jgi:hypothetical protein
MRCPRLPLRSSVVTLSAFDAVSVIIQACKALTARNDVDQGMPGLNRALHSSAPPVPAARAAAAA